jgi:hypothetical protein
VPLWDVCMCCGLGGVRVAQEVLSWYGWLEVYLGALMLADALARLKPTGLALALSPPPRSQWLGLAGQGSSKRTT